MDGFGYWRWVDGGTVVGLSAFRDQTGSEARRFGRRLDTQSRWARAIEFVAFYCVVRLL